MEQPPTEIVRTNVAIPTREPERIQIIDALRGFALCGILIMNIPYFALTFQQADDPRLYGELSQQANHFWWAFVRFYLEGSMRGLFSVLFGAGALLLLGRLEKRNAGLVPADIYFRRLLWLLVFGLINGFLLNWPGDILYHYSIVGMFIFAFRKASGKLLLGFIAFFVALTMLFAFLQKRELFEMRAKGQQAEQLKKQEKKLTEKQEAALAAWEGFQKRRDPKEKRKDADKAAKEIATGSYGDVFEKFSGFTAKFESTKFYGMFFFDIIIFFMLGLYLFKTGIIKGERSLWFYGAMALSGYLLGFGEGLFHYRQVIKANFDPFTYYRQGGLPVSLYQLHRICTTLGHLGLLMVLYKTGFFNWLLKPLARMGQMAFTNYLGQSVICSLLFYGYGFGWFAKYQRYEIYYIWAAIIAFQLIFSFVWLKFFRYGPLEWVWRSLTYWKRQPMKRGDEVVELP